MNQLKTTLLLLGLFLSSLTCPQFAQASNRVHQGREKKETLGRNIGEGGFCRVFRNGNSSWVTKKFKSIVKGTNTSGQYLRLTANAREKRVKLTIKKIRLLRDNGLLIPQVETSSELGLFRQKYVEGYDFNDLNESIKSMAYKNAEDYFNKAIKIAAEDPENKNRDPENKNAALWMVDNGLLDFIFDIDGTVIWWIDPVMPVSHTEHSRLFLK